MEKMKMKSFLIRDILSPAQEEPDDNEEDFEVDDDEDEDEEIEVEDLSAGNHHQQHLHHAAGGGVGLNHDHHSNNHHHNHHHHHHQQQHHNHQTSSGTGGSSGAGSTASTTTSTTSNHTTPAAQAQAAFQMNSPLDALFQMTSTTFDALKRGEKRKAGKESSSNTTTSGGFTGKQSAKKKRKSRTAFTNSQIYELERRFRLQKYLSPTDRDEIAMTLNLSNAQVITWFQNRRAKMKRDLEEQRRDIETASLLNLQKSFFEAFQALTNKMPSD